MARINHSHPYHRPERSLEGGMGVEIDITTPHYRVYVKNSVIVTAPNQDVTDEALWEHPPPGTSTKKHVWDGRCKPATEATETYWKQTIGEYLTKDILVSELANHGIPWPREILTQGRLVSFPRGYTLVTVERINDKSIDRDHYLCTPDGSNRFRSPAEFTPHMAWILKGKQRTEDGETTCECTVCNPGGPSQKEISQRYKDIDDYFAPGRKHVKRSPLAEVKRAPRKSRPLRTSTNHQPTSGSTIEAKYYGKDYRKGLDGQGLQVKN